MFRWLRMPRAPAEVHVTVSAEAFETAFRQLRDAVREHCAALEAQVAALGRENAALAATIEAQREQLEHLSTRVGSIQGQVNRKLGASAPRSEAANDTPLPPPVGAGFAPGFAQFNGGPR